MLGGGDLQSWTDEHAKSETQRGLDADAGHPADRRGGNELVTKVV